MTKKGENMPNESPEEIKRLLADTMVKDFNAHVCPPGFIAVGVLTENFEVAAPEGTPVPEGDFALLFVLKKRQILHLNG
jgi:hypothetical protein